MHIAFSPTSPAAPEADFETFLKLDIRVGTVMDAADFPEARKPAIQLMIDFGEGVGVRKSSAQLTAHYAPADLIGRQVLGVVNFPPRQIGPIMSEVLVLGAAGGDGEIILLAPDRPLPNGARMS